MNPAAKPLYETLKLNTRLFLNCFDGVDDEMAIRRPSDRVNNMAFIGVHTIDARMFIGNLTGCSVTHPFEALSGIRKIDDMTEFPKVADLRKAWTEVASGLVEHVALVSDEVLEKEVSQPFPVEEKTVRGGVAFLVQHESYHIGQLAYLRKLFGLDPMKYD